MTSEQLQRVAYGAFALFVVASLLCLMLAMAEDIERLKRVTAPRLALVNDPPPIMEKPPAMDLPGAQGQPELPLGAA